MAAVIAGVQAIFGNKAPIETTFTPSPFAPSTAKTNAISQHTFTGTSNTIPANKPRAHSIVLLEWASKISGLAAVAILIAGLITGALGITVVGGVFSASSGIAYYYSKKLAYLQDIDDYNRSLSNLNEALGAKNRELSQVNQQLSLNNQEFSKLQQKYHQSIVDNEAAQKILHSQLSETEGKLKETLNEFNQHQTDAANDFREQITAFKESEARFQTAMDADEVKIKQLTQAAGLAKQEASHLQTQLDALQKTLVQYKTQNVEFGRQNDRLQKQIQTLQVPVGIKQEDIKAITDRADDLKKLMTQQNAQVSKISKSSDDINAMFDEFDALTKASSTKK